MKKIILFLSFILLCAIGQAVMKQSADKVTAKQEKRAEREQRRAQKQAAYEKSIDSIILSRNYQFNPQSMQREPAGSMRLLSNPNFDVTMMNGTADIFLPYIKGYVPPYHNVIINYTVPSVDNYVAEQTDEGWMITFETSLYSASTYTFTIDVSSKFGGATLTIKNTWFNTVQYNGTISQLY